MVVGEQLCRARRIAFQAGRRFDPLAAQPRVVGHGVVCRLPAALAAPLVPGLVLLPERVVDGPHMVVEGHVRLARIHRRRWQPPDIRQHVGLDHELPHLGGTVRPLDGGVVFGSKPCLDMVIGYRLDVATELLV